MNILAQLEKALPSHLEKTLQKAQKILNQKRGDPDYLYAWHAPEVECIGKGKAKTPYEFGCKVSLATTLHASGGRHFILHSQVFHGRPLMDIPLGELSKM